jgi:hypothetical protein
MELYADTDHAGCIRTRKSTTGGNLQLGVNQLKSYCRGQAVIALSSGEAEYYGLVTAASEGLGEQSIAYDWGIKIPLHIWMDATAGAAIGTRRGLGKVKHIHTVYLWVQDLFATKRATVGKVGTDKNLADVLTKPVSAELMNRMLNEMGFHWTEGRSSMAFTT